MNLKWILLPSGVYAQILIINVSIIAKNIYLNDEGNCARHEFGYEKAKWDKCR